MCQKYFSFGFIITLFEIDKHSSPNTKILKKSISVLIKEIDHHFTSHSLYTLVIDCIYVYFSKSVSLSHTYPHSHKHIHTLKATNPIQISSERI